MMKAAFVCESPHNIGRVYAEKQLAALKERVNLLEGVFTDIHDARLRDVQVIFSTWGMPAPSEQEIREFLPDLQCVFYAAGSVQAFARPFLNCGVRVFSAWRANGVPVAEYTFAQIILALKGYFPAQAKIRESRAQSAEIAGSYPGVYDVKVGLLGCGVIGSLVAEMLSPLDVQVLVYDPFLPDERAKELNVRRTTLEEIFASCDVVSNHLANLPATVGIIKRAHLLSMKPHSTFINTGRGPQLSEQDLFDMLTADPTRYALLDVMTDEGNSDTNPLNRLPNCLITPHIAGSSGNEVRRMADYMIEAFDQMSFGGKIKHEVFTQMLDTMA